MATTLLLTSLDTKLDEARYLKALIEDLGCTVMLVDTSMRQYIPCGADFTCLDVAREGGVSFEHVRSSQTTPDLVESMVRGCIQIAKGLLERGSIHCIAGFGGASNTLFLSSVMRALPFGFPKLILSSSAAMPTYAARYFAYKDIVMFHSCVDLDGLNSYVRNVLRRFAGMVAGVGRLEGDGEPLTGRQVAVTEFQFVSTCARRVVELCGSGGFEMIPFHAQGVGDRIMEELVASGLFSAVIDLVPAGLSEAIIGGNRSAGLDRLDRELDRGIPVILTPAGFDMVSCGPYERRHGDPFWKKNLIARRKLYVQDELRVHAPTDHDLQTLGDHRLHQHSLQLDVWVRLADSTQHILVSGGERLEVAQV